MTINWTTNAESDGYAAYGLTPELELGVLAGSSNTLQHEVVLENLDPATIYYVRPYATMGTDTTPTSTLVMATASLSSGDINVYFNHSVDHSVATDELAIATDHIIDTIISYINKAQLTLDVTMYEAENQEIVEAINAANARGVVVRVISDDEGNNEIFNNLDQDVPLLKGNTEGIMHNKFILIDRDDVDNSWVMSGSMNHTINNLGWDYNNIICIQDQSLVKAFTLEFNEMWGSDGPEPAIFAAKFGDEKSDNTPHCFNINGVDVGLYFSPSDGTANKIKEAIDASENELAFATLVFTENSLGDAVKDAFDRGMDVRGIIDYVEFNGSEFNYLMNSGVNVIDYQNADGSQWPDGPTLHHKYAILDYASGTDPVLITGSHNWSASANSIHDENTLIIHDSRLANLYHQEFNERFNNLINDTEELVQPVLSIFPNPNQGWLGLNLPEDGQLVVSNLAGQVIFTRSFQAGQQQLNIEHFPKGMYVLQFNNRVAKLIKQ